MARIPKKPTTSPRARVAAKPTKSTATKTVAAKGRTAKPVTTTTKAKPKPKLTTKKPTTKPAAAKPSSAREPSKATQPQTPLKASTLKIATPIRAQDFRPIKGGSKPQRPIRPKEDDGLRLMEYVAAIRREFEAVALIAAPEEREVPQFHLSEVELDMSYLVTSVDDEGVRIEINPSKLVGTDANLVHRAKLKFVDLEVGDQSNSADEQ